MKNKYTRFTSLPLSPSLPAERSNPEIEVKINKMKNENRYIVKNIGICKCGAFNSGLLRRSCLTARNDGAALIYNPENPKNLIKIVVQTKK